MRCTLLSILVLLASHAHSFPASTGPGEGCMRKWSASCKALVSSVQPRFRAPAARPASASAVADTQRKVGCVRASVVHAMSAGGAGETTAAADALAEPNDISQEDAQEGGMDPGRAARRAARKARKEAAKETAAERDKAGAGGAKPCTSCSSPVHLLIRCQTDTTKQWKMLCGKCWHKASGGVPDGDADHPHYRYGGLWKSKALRNGDVSVKTPQFTTSQDARTT